MALSAEEKRRFLRALEEDLEFRYAVAGLLGYGEVLKRLDSYGEVQARIWEEIKAINERMAKTWKEIEGIKEEEREIWREIERLREEVAKIWEEIRGIKEEQKKIWASIERLQQEQTKIWEEIKGIKEEQKKIWEEIKGMKEEQARLGRRVDKLEGALYYGFYQLHRFAGITFERFVRRLLTRELVKEGVIPRGKRLREEVVDGEQIDIFLDDPLIVGEVTAYAETEGEVDKLLKKVRVAESRYGRQASRKILIVLAAPRGVAKRLRRRCQEEGIELILGRTV